MSAWTTTHEVHDQILRRAAEIANRMLRERDDRPRTFQVDSDPFRPVPANIQHGKLSLEVDTGMGEDMIGIPREEREHIQRIIQEIGPVAIHQAILENKELFVGLITGHAKQGRNYFDYFDDSDQRRLF